MFHSHFTTRFNIGDRVSYVDDGGQGTVTNVRMTNYYPSEASLTVVYAVEWDDGKDSGDEYLANQLV